MKVNLYEMYCMPYVTSKGFERYYRKHLTAV